MVIAPPLADPDFVYTVNQELPISISWSPVGFARGYSLEIATNDRFDSPVLSVPSQTDAF